MRCPRVVEIRKSRRKDDEPWMWGTKVRVDWAIQLLEHAREHGKDTDFVEHLLGTISGELAEEVVRNETKKVPDVPDVDYLNGGGWDDDAGFSTND
jgi:hypothetical protein